MITIKRIGDFEQIVSDKYKIVKSKHGGFVLINLDGTSENHGHLEHIQTCYLVMDLIERKVVPDAPYLRKCCLRVSTDNKYKQEIRIKQDKDKNKPKYNNRLRGTSAFNLYN